MIATSINAALQTGINKGLDLIVFPELAGSEDIEKQISTSPLKVIVGPSRVVDNFNVCPIFCKGSVYTYRKLHRSKYEDSPWPERGFA